MTTTWKAPEEYNRALAMMAQQQQAAMMHSPIPVQQQQYYVPRTNGVPVAMNSPSTRQPIYGPPQMQAYSPLPPRQNLPLGPTFIQSMPISQPPVPARQATYPPMSRSG
jgi:hypothetical protein